MDEKKIQAFNDITLKILQRAEPKMIGTRKENGVSNAYVLSMRSYAHTQAKYAKKDFLSKYVKLPL